jgi:hypothetical protein
VNLSFSFSFSRSTEPTGAVSEAVAAATAAARFRPAEDPASLSQPRRAKSAAKATALPLPVAEFFSIIIGL